MADSVREVRLETPALDPRPAVTSEGALGQGLAPAIRLLPTSHWGPLGEYRADLGDRVAGQAAGTNLRTNRERTTNSECGVSVSSKRWGEPSLCGP